MQLLKIQKGAQGTLNLRKSRAPTSALLVTALSFPPELPAAPLCCFSRAETSVAGLVELEEEKQKVAAQREQKQAKKERYNQRKEAKKAGAAKPAAAASPSTK